MKEWERRAGNVLTVNLSPLMCVGVFFALVCVGGIVTFVRDLVNGTLTPTLTRVLAAVISISMALAIICILRTRKHWIADVGEPEGSGATGKILGISIMLGGLLVVIACLASGTAGIHWGVFALIGGAGMALTGRFGKFRE